jgi:predicted TPR repeat methyltransferase
MSVSEAREILRRARREWRKGRHASARELLREAAAVAPDDAPVRAAIAGFERLWRGEHADACSGFDEALAADPEDRDARAGRMLALRALAADEPPTWDCATYLCGSARAYRQLADELPQPDDVVVEIGASTGEATRRLAGRALRVIAVEQSPQMVEMARATLSDAGNVTLLQADARQLAPVLAETARADCVFVDISGSAPPWTTLRLAERYRSQLRPRCLVIRNVRLARFVSSVRFCEGMKPDDAREGNAD